MNAAVSNDEQESILMVSTDLDGTLLDHHDYSWSAINPALSRLNNLHIPVIINTSKTSEEVVLLQKEMSLTAPFIVENGSAILLPKSMFKLRPDDVLDCGGYWKRVFGSSRVLIIEVLKKLRKNYSWVFEGFYDWDEQQIMAHTGLDQNGANLALKRAFSEPILWQDTAEALDKFKIEIRKYNLRILQGGRFIHVLGNTNKSVPLLWLSHYYSTMNHKNIEWIVLGDSDNDVDMLKMATYPVAVKSPVGQYPSFVGLGETIFTQDYGPKGWNKAILKILNNY